MATGVLRERLRRDRIFQLGLALAGLVVTAALLAPWVSPFDPLKGDLRNAYLPGPGGRFVLGTDSQARDAAGAMVAAPWVWFAPGIAIGSAVLGFNLVGDALRAAYDPKLRSER